MVYDVIIIGAGPSGLYSGLIIQTATPVQSIPEDFSVKIIEAANCPGGLTKYGFIQISKKWAFHGKNLVGALYQECLDAGVSFNFNEKVLSIEENDIFTVKTNKAIYYAKYVIVATGIMTYPDVMLNPGKTNIGLHTPNEMAREFVENYGWKTILVVGNHTKSINSLRSQLAQYFDKADAFTISNKDYSHDSDYINGVPSKLYGEYDGIVYDYNSYKLKNGTTDFLKTLPLNFINGYISSDEFGETSIANLFVVGTVTTPTSGVMAAIYSAQIAAFAIGRRLCKTTKSDASGRFPFFPREKFWADSYQNQITL